jgi:hypothetical protein
VRRVHFETVGQVRYDVQAAFRCTAERWRCWRLAGGARNSGHIFAKSPPLHDFGHSAPLVLLANSILAIAR